MHEGDLLDQLSVAALLAAAVAAGVYAVRCAPRRGRFALLTAIVAFLALDDAFGVHEQISDAMAAAIGIGKHGDVLFLIPYLPLCAAAVWILWSAAREAPPRAGRTLVLGLALLAAAVGLRALAALVSFADVSLDGGLRSVGVAALHDTELLAWIAVAVGLALLPVVTGAATSRRTGPHQARPG